MNRGLPVLDRFLVLTKSSAASGDENDALYVCPIFKAKELNSFDSDPAKRTHCLFLFSITIFLVGRFKPTYR